MYTAHIILVLSVICTVWAQRSPELHSPPANLRQQTKTGEVTILKSAFENEGQGTYFWEFENSDGTKSQQKGYLKNAGTENEIQVMEGSFTWFAPDGEMFATTYISDENGYQPMGTHLVKPK